ncbi:transcription elongation factor GreA [Candidatus Schneideria nysicola]|uniref:transcription elongation factor GreA n=1 Tax=Candidatus Schneideria nysicola TaxID=1081631 RepID=UPI001CAA4AD0|nr:transcription elongation factor GreA [Candidatus Schneideria nysicola]UAJ64903.1 transcription elongation factor GreA [Candidatus Schneideria nysicola]UAJ65437.1 transcription elongation factor GreA [Candidatus Schneideria nysicola]
MNQIPMTVRGLEKLREELLFLRDIRRPEIIKNIAEARKHGDLKENAEYHAAREQQIFCENRIKEIENKLSHAQVIDITKIPPSNRIVFGTTISIKNLYSGDKKTYRIVGNDEADLKQHLISINSPLARGLIGKKLGECVVITTPSGKITYKILKIEYL